MKNGKRRFRDPRRITVLLELEEYMEIVRKANRVPLSTIGRDALLEWAKRQGTKR